MWTLGCYEGFVAGDRGAGSTRSSLSGRSTVVCFEVRSETSEVHRWIVEWNANAIYRYHYSKRLRVRSQRIRWRTHCTPMIDDVPLGKQPIRCVTSCAPTTEHSASNGHLSSHTCSERSRHANETPPSRPIPRQPPWLRPTASSRIDLCVPRSSARGSPYAIRTSDEDTNNLLRQLEDRLRGFPSNYPPLLMQTCTFCHAGLLTFSCAAKDSSLVPSEDDTRPGRGDLSRSRNRTIHFTMPVGLLGGGRRRSPQWTSQKHRKKDQKVLRGAAVIREQIRKQFAVDQTRDFSSDEDDFSDPWRADFSLIESPVRNENDADSSFFPKSEMGSNFTFPTKGDASQWANLSEREEPPPSPPSDGTPISYMGRGKSIRMKRHTYLVESYGFADDATYDFVEDDYAEEHELEDYDRLCSKLSYLPSVLQQMSDRSLDLTAEEPTVVSEPPVNKDKHTASTASCTVDGTVVSLRSLEYEMLMKDPAYRHAQAAGYLWQSLVGQQIRFPSRWWNGARGPPIGEEGGRWEYVGRYSIPGHRMLKKTVRNRASAGRILLHVIVQDLMTGKPVQDIVVGCFHPNARSIRQSQVAESSKEDSREVWLAVRKRSDGISVLEPMLKWGAARQECGKGPLLAKVTNDNVRAIYGDKPPLETIFLPESELFERLTSTNSSRETCPPLMLLDEFVFG